MNIVHLLIAATILSAFAASANSLPKAAQAPQVKEAHAQVMKELRKICAPAHNMSEAAFEQRILAGNAENQRHVRDASIAYSRNNPDNYWEALGKVQCPDL